MKQAVKRAVTVLVMMALVFGATQCVQGVKAQAAGKLTKKDFTKTYGSNKFNFMKISADSPNHLLCGYVDGSDDDDFKTYRGIKLKDSKDKVLEKYGKAKVKKVNLKEDNIYYAGKKRGYGSAKVIKKAKSYVEYTYKKAKYRIRFYFDKNNKVSAFAYTKNYANFRNAAW